MNILITGSNGFIARNLLEQLNQKYNIDTINKNNCNLLDYKSVKNFFTNKHKTYDLILHTAVEGGRRNKADSPDLVYANLVMLYNLLDHQKYFQHIVSFGSGAELDRRYDINEDTYISERYPIDPYGLSKNIINKLCSYEKKLSNFRIFNCFGKDEQPDRMIRGNIHRYLNKESIILHQNKKMDFFFIDDLVILIDYCIKNNFFPKNINCCYKEKYSLLDIATIINGLDNYQVPIEIIDNTFSYDYIGKECHLPITYIGLIEGIKNVYAYYKDKGKSL